jgi:hypothetical protein
VRAKRGTERDGRRTRSCGRSLQLRDHIERDGKMPRPLLRRRDAVRESAKDRDEDKKGLVRGRSRRVPRDELIPASFLRVLRTGRSGPNVLAASTPVSVSAAGTAQLQGNRVVRRVVIVSGILALSM